MASKQKGKQQYQSISSKGYRVKKCADSWQNSVMESVQSKFSVCLLATRCSVQLVLGCKVVHSVFPGQLLK